METLAQFHAESWDKVDEFELPKPFNDFREPMKSTIKSVGIQAQSNKDSFLNCVMNKYKLPLHMDFIDIYREVIEDNILNLEKSKTILIIYSHFRFTTMLAKSNYLKHFYSILFLQKMV